MMRVTGGVGGRMRKEEKRGWGCNAVERAPRERDEARVCLMPIYIGKGRRSGVTGLDSRLRERQEKFYKIAAQDMYSLEGPVKMQTA